MVAAVEGPRESLLGFGWVLKPQLSPRQRSCWRKEVFRLAYKQAGEAVKHEAGAVVIERVKGFFKPLDIAAGAGTPWESAGA
jgi:hypothetical protein